MIQFEQDENVLFEVRKHWFIIVSEIVGLFFLAFLPLLIPLLINWTGFIIVSELTFGQIWAIYIFLHCFWLLLLWIIGFVFWTNYYLDIWIITNKKIINVNQIGLFSRQISVLHLDRVQDITTEVHGILGTYLKFGNMHVQTAGQQREFVISGITDPVAVANRLNDVLIKYLKKDVYHR